MDGEIFERAAIALLARFLVALLASLIGRMVRVVLRRRVVVLIGIAGRLGLFLFLQLFSQSRDFVGQFVAIGAEGLDQIQQFPDRPFRCLWQLPRQGQPLLHLFQHRLDS